MIRYLRAVIALSAVVFTAALVRAEGLALESPGQKLQAVFALSPEGTLTYRVTFGGVPVILPSKLGFTTVDRTDLTLGYALVSAKRATIHQTWKNPFGERAQVTDAYNALTLILRNRAANDLTLHLECRAYDAGLAFRYVFPQQSLTQLLFAKENTEFIFTGDHRAWPVYSAQAAYKPARLSEIRNGCERPLTVETAEGPVAAIGEAGLLTFARMKFAPLAGTPHALTARLDGQASLPLPGATPWRFIMVAENAARLLEQNDLLLNLNEPSRIADLSWIRPGKVIRETSLTTAGGKACVDFCKTMNLQFVEFDAGWYGHEYDDAADARGVNLDPKRSKGPLDLPEVIRYAKARDVGVILYVNRRELERRLDELLPLYASWGVVGMKYGFVQVGSQTWTTWLHEAIRKAGEARIMIDIHDEYRLTGNQRTWPNVMTVEGIRGNEEMPDAAHNCALPFTRYLCGPGDYTPCWYNNRVKNTRAHQLALAAVTFSPWQFLFWYDRPSMYQAEPELDFWRQIPTVWDDTRVLHARIGAYASIARRSGETWFIGSINALERRSLDLPLSFLSPNVRYTAHVYSDAAPDGSDRTRVACATRIVTSADTLTADMAENGGHAVRLTPVAEQPVCPAIREALRGSLDSHEVAGAVSLVLTADRTLHFDACGHADLAAKKPMTPDAIFWIASMTKPVIASAILMLQDEGKLSIDAPAATHLPELANLKTADGRGFSPTVKHLLTHTSGLSEPTQAEAFAARTLAELMPHIVSKPLRFEPGTKWQYSQSGINALGRIVEVVSQQSLPAFLKARLFDPLGMRDTTFYPDAAQCARIAKAYRQVDGRLEEADMRALYDFRRGPDRYPAANGGLYSTAADYGRFCRMLLKRGTAGDRRILSTEAVAAFSSLQSGELKTGFTDGMGWSLGCGLVRQPQGVTAKLSPGTFGHGGAYGTQAWIDPVRGAAYILMVQRADFPNADASEIRRAFQDAASAIVP
ncbi:MAG TPA: serine hydrolase [Kiritimatiellia bacterium]|jgi:alpha-glucosidase|nr:serine hydrolase [Kiritimatiellia bacterium]